MFASKPGWLAAMLALCTSLAVAQANDREQEQLKRMKGQLRQLQQEQATLQSAVQEAQSQSATEKAKAEQAIKAAQAESRTVKSTTSRQVSSLSAQVSSLTRDKARLAEQVDQLQLQLKRQQEDAAAQAKVQQAQSARSVADWQGRHQQQAQWYDACRTQNAQLYALGVDLLWRYEHKGMAEVLATNEPFLQTARVRLENVKAELMDKLEAARVAPTAAASPSVPPK